MKKHLEAKNFFEIKQTAIQLAPGGVPSFELLFKEGETSQISTLNREFGKEVTAKLIFLMLEDLNNYFNVSRPMTSGQITELAIELTDVLWGYRIEEILAFSEAVKKGTYGKIYERLDPAIIWEHLSNYEESRQKYFYNEQVKHRQNDPYVEHEDDHLKRGFGKLSGAIDQIRSNIKGGGK